MKKCYFLFSVVLSFTVASTATAQDFDNPGEYMTYINKQQVNISKKFMSYASASAHGKKAKKVESLRLKLMDEVQEAKMNISAMPSYKGDKSYRDSTVDFMKLYFNVLNEDYSKVINLEEVAEQSYDAMEAYFLAKELIDKKMEEGNARIRRVQTDFAQRNNVRLLEGENELGEMMKKVHEVGNYYHQLYLVFFKPFKQEVYLMEAIEKGNITGIEQNKSALQKYAEEGMAKLASLPAFGGDNSLVTACKQVMNFYLKEVKDMNTISDFFLNKEAFDKLKKDFEKKSSPSQAEVDAYNKGVNDINKASEAYNRTNNDLNRQRSQTLKEWNDAVDAFFDQHTPHYN